MAASSRLKAANLVGMACGGNVCICTGTRRTGSVVSVWCTGGCLELARRRNWVPLPVCCGGSTPCVIAVHADMPAVQSGGRGDWRPTSRKTTLKPENGVTTASQVANAQLQVVPAHACGGFHAGHQHDTRATHARTIRAPATNPHNAAGMNTLSLHGLNPATCRSRVECWAANRLEHRHACYPSGHTALPSVPPRHRP